MKYFLRPLIVLLFPVASISQQAAHYAEQQKKLSDSLYQALREAPNDTIRMDASRALGFYYQLIQLDSALYYHEQQLQLAKKLKLGLWEADAYSQKDDVLNHMGNYPKALLAQMEGKKIAENPASEKNSWNVSRFSNSENAHHARLSILAMHGEGAPSDRLE